MILETNTRILFPQLGTHDHIFSADLLPASIIPSVLASLSAQRKVSSRHCLQRPLGHESLPANWLDFSISLVVQVRTQESLSVDPVVIEKAYGASKVLAISLKRKAKGKRCNIQRHITVHIRRTLLALLMHTLTQVPEGPSALQGRLDSVDLFKRISDLFDGSSATKN